MKMTENAELKAAKKSRSGHRGWATNLVTEITEKLATETETEELIALQKSFKEKLDLLKELDAKIVDLMGKDDDIDEDVMVKEAEASGKLRTGMLKVLVQLERKRKSKNEPVKAVGDKESESRGDLY